MGVDPADFDGDGRQDLFVANVDQEMFSLYHNDGNEVFADVAAPHGVAQATRLLSGWGLQGTGCNRESPLEEATERQDHSPLDPSSPPPEDAAGRVGEEPLDDLRDRHTSHKAGARSIAQKEDEARYPARSMPASHKVSGVSAASD